MFGRTPKESSTPADEAAPERAGAKGRPTPSRREAQQAYRERAKLGMDSKQAKKVLAERRSTDAAKARQGMREGDERYLMRKDKGPVRRFVRDFVDHRRSFMEFVLPILVFITATSFTGNPQLVAIGTDLWVVTLLGLVVESVWVERKLRRALNERFSSDAPGYRGWRWYALLRGIQLRRLRLPKTQVRPGQELPTHYR